MAIPAHVRLIKAGSHIILAAPVSYSSLCSSGSCTVVVLGQAIGSHDQQRVPAIHKRSRWRIDLDLCRSLVDCAYYNAIWEPARWQQIISCSVHPTHTSPLDFDLKVHVYWTPSSMWIVKTTSDYRILKDNHRSCMRCVLRKSAFKDPKGHVSQCSTAGYKCRYMVFQMHNCDQMLYAHCVQCLPCDGKCLAASPFEELPKGFSSHERNIFYEHLGRRIEAEEHGVDAAYYWTPNHPADPGKHSKVAKLSNCS